MNQLIQGYTKNNNEAHLNNVIGDYIPDNIHKCCECEEWSMDTELCIACEFHQRDDLLRGGCKDCDMECENRACQRCLKDGNSTYFPQDSIPSTFLIIHYIKKKSGCGAKVFICENHAQKWSKNCNEVYCRKRLKKFEKVPIACSNHHCDEYSCTKCINPCNICRNYICKECTHDCSRCRKATCYHCFVDIPKKCFDCNTNSELEEERGYDAAFDEVGMSYYQAGGDGY